jgi:peptide deformylase
MTLPDRPILQLGHPKLRQTATAVTDIHNPELQKLIDDLLTTLRSANGVGIAAPQVNESIQIMVIASRPTPRYPNAPEMEPIALINPKIIDKSIAMEKGWEGCLSVPQYRGFVPRHQSVTVEYTDRSGQIVQKTFTDFVARIFQHEYDHFLGLVFLDRLESESDRVTAEEFKAMFPDALPLVNAIDRKSDY